MPHTVEVTYHQGSDREFTYEGIFSTMDEAFDQAKSWAEGMGGLARVWIDNKELRINV